MPIDPTYVFTIVFYLSCAAAYPTVIVALRCVTVSINYYLSIYLSICSCTGSREQAFVYALSSAAVLQAVAKTCSTGIASKCGCGRPPPTSQADGDARGGVEGFRWGGCADNVAFGAEFSRAFCDARWIAGKRRRRINRRSATNLHNNNAGRTVRDIIFNHYLFTLNKCTSDVCVSSREHSFWLSTY